MTSLPEKGFALVAFAVSECRSLGPDFPVRRHDVFPDGSFVTAIGPTAVARLEGVSELQIILNFATVVAERVGARSG